MKIIQCGTLSPEIHKSTMQKLILQNNSILEIKQVATVTLVTAHVADVFDRQSYSPGGASESVSNV